MSLAQKPPRLTLVNVRTRQRVTVQFNPASLQIGLQVGYQRQTVLGMSHQPLQYTHTGNVKIPLELFSLIDSDLETDRAPTPRFFANGQRPGAGFNRNDIPEGRSLEQVRARENFFQSLCYPEAGAGTVRRGAPPRVIVVWPKYLSMTCVVTDWRTTVERFNVAGDPVVLQHKLGLEEIRDVRLSSSDVLTAGWRRTETPTDAEELF